MRSKNAYQTFNYRLVEVIFFTFISLTALQTVALYVFYRFYFFDILYLIVIILCYCLLLRTVELKLKFHYFVSNKRT